MVMVKKCSSGINNAGFGSDYTGPSNNTGLGSENAGPRKQLRRYLEVIMHKIVEDSVLR